MQSELSGGRPPTFGRDARVSMSRGSMGFATPQVLQLVAGGLAGTLGAIVTCPLEVLKTRFQSSLCDNVAVIPKGIPLNKNKIASLCPNLKLCIREILAKDGFHGFYRGVVPNIVGVFPSRAIYFCTYSQTKEAMNRTLPKDSWGVHIISAVSAGFVNSSMTNPIWLVKTKLQLNEGNSVSNVIYNVYRERGFLGFYKGISASYLGITETVLHFLIYENLKQRFRQLRSEEGSTQFTTSMVSAGISKTVATTLAYPHEVIRTRLREQGSTYISVPQTFRLIITKYGWKGLYRGLGIHLFRQVPNTAIMMSAYELILDTISPKL